MYEYMNNPQYYKYIWVYTAIYGSISLGRSATQAQSMQKPSQVVQQGLEGKESCELTYKGPGTGNIDILWGKPPTACIPESETKSHGPWRHSHVTQITNGQNWVVWAAMRERALQGVRPPREMAKRDRENMGERQR